MNFLGENLSMPQEISVLEVLIQFFRTNFLGYKLSFRLNLRNLITFTIFQIYFSRTQAYQVRFLDKNWMKSWLFDLTLCDFHLWKKFNHLFFGKEYEIMI